MQYPPDPPRPEEIVQVMRRAGNDRHGLRVRALIAVLWRGGLRISEALALRETDMDEHRGSLLVRHGKGDKRREAGMDQWGFEQLNAWLAHRVALPVGPLFCVIDGPTRGRAWAVTAARAELCHLAADAGVRRRFAPHQLRHAHAVELACEGVAVNIIQRQLGHTDLGTTFNLPAGHRPKRDHRRRPLTPAADHLRHRRADTLIDADHRPLPTQAAGGRFDRRTAQASAPRILRIQAAAASTQPVRRQRGSDNVTALRMVFVVALFLSHLWRFPMTGGGSVRFPGCMGLWPGASDS